MSDQKNTLVGNPHLIRHYVEGDPNWPNDLVSLRIAADILGMSYGTLQYKLSNNSLNIPVYDATKAHLGSYSIRVRGKDRRVKYALSRKDVIRENASNPSSGVCRIPSGVYLVTRSACFYLCMTYTSFRWNINKNPIFKKPGAVLPPSHPELEDFKLNHPVFSLRHIHLFMKEHIDSNLTQSIYYHRIMYDNSAIFPDDARYTRVENVHSEYSLRQAIEDVRARASRLHKKPTGNI